MPEDMRQQPRFQVENTVFVELVAAEFGSNESGIIVECKSMEISKGGLRLTLEQDLPLGAILQFAVELPGTAEALYLVGEVNWSHPLPLSSDGPCWRAGLSLFDADNSNIDDWAELVKMMER